MITALSSSIRPSLSTSHFPFKSRQKQLTVLKWSYESHIQNVRVFRLSPKKKAIDRKMNVIRITLCRIPGLPLCSPLQMRITFLLSEASTDSHGNSAKLTGLTSASPFKLTWSQNPIRAGAVTQANNAKAYPFSVSPVERQCEQLSSSEARSYNTCLRVMYIER